MKPRDTPTNFEKRNSSKKLDFFFPRKIGEQLATLSLDSIEKSMHSARSLQCFDNQKGTSAPSVAGIPPTRRSRPPTIYSQNSKKQKSSLFRQFLQKPEDQIPTSASPPCRRSPSDQGVLLVKLIPFQFLTTCKHNPHFTDSYGLQVHSFATTRDTGTKYISELVRDHPSTKEGTRRANR